jgi:hypothetical protein
MRAHQTRGPRLSVRDLRRAGRGLDHRVTDDLQHKQLTVADELAGEGEHVLDRFLGEDRAAGGDPADERDVRRGGLARGRCGSRRRKPLRSSAIN